VKALGAPGAPAPGARAAVSTAASAARVPAASETVVPPASDRKRRRSGIQPPPLPPPPPGHADEFDAEDKRSMALSKRLRPRSPQSLVEPTDPLMETAEALGEYAIVGATADNFIIVRSGAVHLQFTIAKTAVFHFGCVAAAKQKEFGLALLSTYKGDCSKLARSDAELGAL
jgi:hypothetical protein